MDRYQGFELREIQLELKRIDVDCVDADEMFDEQTHLSPESMEELFDLNEHWKTLII